MYHVTTRVCTNIVECTHSMRGVFCVSRVQDLDEFQTHLLLKRILTADFKDKLDETATGQQLNLDLEFLIYNVGMLFLDDFIFFCYI